MGTVFIPGGTWLIEKEVDRERLDYVICSPAAIIPYRFVELPLQTLGLQLTCNLHVFGVKTQSAMCIINEAIDPKSK